MSKEKPNLSDYIKDCAIADEKKQIEKYWNDVARYFYKLNKANKKGE